MPPRILLAPLDWGLGHTTRIIPVGKALLDMGARLCLAGNPVQLAILSEAFPEAPALPLPGYNVTYGSRLPASWHVAAQLPRLMKVIRHEHLWLHELVQTRQIDAVVSDNRYGLWNSRIPSAMVCHQLAPPLGGRLGQALLWRLHRQFLNRFDEVWIPDLPGRESLAGSMVPESLPPDYHLIGPLSRLAHASPALTPALADLPLPEILVLLSGPEPQRSLLEAWLLPQLQEQNSDVWLVQGLPGLGRKVEARDNITTISYLNAEELAAALPLARVVVARSGYSSLMDFQFLGIRHPILMPTPGQPEQEYLARRLAAEGRAILLGQSPGALRRAVEAVANVRGFEKTEGGQVHLAKTVGKFLGKLSST